MQVHKALLSHNSAFSKSAATHWGWTGPTQAPSCRLPGTARTSVASIMLEINRKLYLEDGSSDKNGDYDIVRQIIQDYLDVISSNVTA